MFIGIDTCVLQTMQGYLYNTLPAVNTCTRSLGLNAHINLRLDKHV